jgi:hypothetical protein
MAPELIGIAIAMSAIALILLMVFAIVRMEQRGDRGAHS